MERRNFRRGESGWPGCRADGSGEADAGGQERCVPRAKREAGTASKREGTAEVREQAEGCALPVCACLLLILKVIDSGDMISLLSPSFSLSEEKNQGEEVGRGRGMWDYKMLLGTLIPFIPFPTQKWKRHPSPSKWQAPSSLGNWAGEWEEEAAAEPSGRMRLWSLKLLPTSYRKDEDPQST